MAPPMPAAVRPGTIQLATLPSWSTWNAPSTVAATWPPRMSPKDSKEPTKLPPCRRVVKPPEASITSGSSLPSSGFPARPITPFSD